MLQEEHSAILSIYIKLPFLIKIFVLSIFESHLQPCNYQLSKSIVHEIKFGGIAVMLI